MTADSQKDIQSFKAIGRICAETLYKMMGHVRAGYLQMVQQEPSRWAVVDAGREWASVQEELRKVVEEKLNASPQ